MSFSKNEGVGENNSKLYYRGKTLCRCGHEFIIL